MIKYFFCENRYLSKYSYKSKITLVGLLENNIKEPQPSDKCDNSFQIIPWATNENSVHFCASVTRTCFRMLGILLYFHEHCLYITFQCFFCYSFISIPQNVSHLPTFTIFIYLILFLSSDNLKCCHYIFLTH